MTYRIKVTKVEPNPDYAEQVKAAEGRRMYEPPISFAGGNYPSKEREVGALEVLITPEEWEIVKRALVQFWASESMKDHPKENEG